MTSGIKVSDEVTQAIAGVCSSRKNGVSIAVFRINDAYDQIIMDVCYNASETGEDVLKFLRDKLPKSEPRYCVVDFSYQTDEGQDRSKVISISWCPDSSSIKKKMVYASSKEAFEATASFHKKCQASDMEELSFNEIRTKCLM